MSTVMLVELQILYTIGWYDLTDRKFLSNGVSFRANSNLKVAVVYLINICSF